MKKAYKQRIELLRKRRKFLLAIAIFSMCFLTYLWFVPINCESISKSHILFDGKQISPKQCWNFYGHRIMGLE